MGVKCALLFFFYFLIYRNMIIVLNTQPIWSMEIAKMSSTSIRNNIKMLPTC